MFLTITSSIIATYFLTSFLVRRTADRMYHPYRPYRRIIILVNPLYFRLRKTVISTEEMKKLDPDWQMPYIPRSGEEDI
jgi:hypothetical protein